MKRQPLLTETGYAAVDKDGNYFCGIRYDGDGTNASTTWANNPFLAHLFKDAQEIGEFIQIHGADDLFMVKQERSVKIKGQPMKAVLTTADLPSPPPSP